MIGSLLSLRKITGIILINKNSFLIKRNRFILSGSYDRKVRVWGSDGKECLAFAEGHTGAVTGVAWLSHG